MKIKTLISEAKHFFIMLYDLIKYFFLYQPESDLIPLDLSKHSDDKILIVTAHPDDEIFSLYNIVTRIDNKENITWLNVTKGQNSYSNDLDTEQMAELRDMELHQSAKHLGIKNIINLKLNCYMDNHKSAVLKKYLDGIDDFDVVFVMHNYDDHIDHQLVSEVIQQKMSSANLYLYNIIQSAPINKYTHCIMYDDITNFDYLCKIYGSQYHMKYTFKKHKYIKLLQKQKSIDKRYYDTLIYRHGDKNN